MCVIAGFCDRSNRAMLARMADAIAHRGPDDVGEWYSDDLYVGLTHHRFSIIDLSTNVHQPMVDASGSAVIVFDGQIYDFRELRAQLEAEDYRFRGHSDTEVLLALYKARGEDVVRGGLRNTTTRLGHRGALVIWCQNFIDKALTKPARV
jgi:asparagine synthase (glutamine-hydrolysing)